MEAIDKIESLFEGNNKDFHGFLACLIYTKAHREFRKFVKDDWETLHDLSGKSALIMAAERPESEITVPLPSPQISTGVIGYLTALGPTTNQSTNQINKQMADEFGLKYQNMPSIVFFDGAEVMYTLTYSFRGSSSILDDMMTIFNACNEIRWEPTAGDQNDLPDYRNRMMSALKGELNSLKFRKALASPSAKTFGNLLSNTGRIAAGIAP